MKIFRGKVLVLAVVSVFPTITIAYEHEDSLVEFVEYREGVVTDAKQKNKPYFLLFSAQWCHWCHEFAEKTLVRKDVADYLNDNFVNVFIDVDIHNAAYVKYRATGLPYTVFLNPDGSVYYKYTGTLYGDDFLDVIRQVAGDVGVGKSAFGEQYAQISYTPPRVLAESELNELPDLFRSGLIENFDAEEYGVGTGQKALLPRTFLYLLDSTRDQGVVEVIAQTLERAIDTIYDPVEGGFFRYAETRDWQIPHYEKFADLNAGAILLLHKTNRIRPSPTLQQAAAKTLDYLTTTLFDTDSGAFLSFQIADTYYYFLNEESRKTARQPKVMDKIFGDRLAATLGYLIQVMEYTNDPDLNDKVAQSLDFLGEMIMSGRDVRRYYVVPNKQWLGQGGLSDHAYSAHLFVTAASHFDNPQYKSVAIKVVRDAINKYYSREQQLFIDPTVNTTTSAEYLMEMNGLLVLAMMELSPTLAPNEKELIEPVVKYFSQIGEVLEERFWESVEWEFAETYIPYLRAAELLYPH
ncbi:MAG: DUF255 domain-containing protein [Arenicellales bacterium]|nr:DUF255 domain-containing protein [Arenicellales bacterium]